MQHSKATMQIEEKRRKEREEEIEEKRKKDFENHLDNFIQDKNNNFYCKDDPHNIAFNFDPENDKYNMYTINRENVAAAVEHAFKHNDSKKMKLSADSEEEMCIMYEECLKAGYESENIKMKGIGLDLQYVVDTVEEKMQGEEKKKGNSAEEEDVKLDDIDLDDFSLDDLDSGKKEDLKDIAMQIANGVEEEVRDEAYLQYEKPKIDKEREEDRAKELENYKLKYLPDYNADDDDDDRGGMRPGMQ